MGLTIIIGHHNEEQEFTASCVRSLLSTIDVDEYEVVVVDDYSSTPLEPIEGVTVVRHEKNKGIGSVFDTGVSLAKHENIILMANDIRFENNQWASKLLKEIEEHPTSFTCTACIKISDNKTFSEQVATGWYGTGSNIKVWGVRENNTRYIFGSEWLSPKAKGTDPSFEVPCLWGAIYGVKKSWYEHVDGWAGHIRWGTLEAYISIKSYMFGGTCRVAPYIHIGHIGKEIHPHRTSGRVLLFNQLLIPLLLLDGYDQYHDYLSVSYGMKDVDMMVQERAEWIKKKREEYAQKRKLSFSEYCNRFNIPLTTDDGMGLTGAKEEGAEYYDAIFMQHPDNLRYQSIYKKVSEVAGSRRVLDIGCGSAKLREHIENYRGFDFIPQMIKHLQDQGADVWMGDIHDRANFVDADLYVSIEVLEHIIKDLVVVENIPSGKDVVITVPSFKGVGHVRVYTEEMVRQRYKGLLDVHKITYFVWKGGVWIESDTLTAPFILFIEATRT